MSLKSTASMQAWQRSDIASQAFLSCGSADFGRLESIMRTKLAALNMFRGGPEAILRILEDEQGSSEDLVKKNHL